MTSLPPIATLAILFGLLPPLLRWTRLPAWAVPATAVTVVIGWLYAAGLASRLNEGRWVLMVLAPLVGGVAMTSLVHRGDWRARILHPGLVFFVLGSLGAWWATMGDHLHFWDEFSHWGTAVKAMYLTGGLPVADTALLFTGYPPAATLFDYFFAAVDGVDESGILLAQYVLYLSGASAVFTFTPRFTWRVLPAVLLIYLATTVFGPHYFGLRTAYVDHLMGAIGTAALMLGLSGRRSAQLVAVAAVTFTLPLIKDAGLFVGLVVVATVAVIHIIRLVRCRMLMKSRRGRRAWAFRAAVVLLVVLAPLAASTSWKVWLSAHNLTRTVDASQNPSVLPALMGDPMTQQQSVAADAMVNAFWGRFVRPGDWPQAEYIYLLAMASIYFMATKAAKRNKERTDIKIVSAFLFIGFVLYKIGLFSLYSFSLGMPDAIYMNSYHRYTGIYAMLVALMGVGLLARPSSPDWRGTRTASLLLMLVIGGFITLPANWRWITFTADGLTDQAKNKVIDAKISFVKKHSQTGKVFVLWHNRPRNYPYFKAYYSLLPWRSSQCATFRPDATQPEWSTCALVDGRPSSRLEGYDFLLVLGATDQFWSDMGGAITEASRKANHFFYRLDQNAAGLTATPVDPVAQEQLIAGLRGQPARIRSFGPPEIIAGKAFNQQPDGSSAIWLEASGLDAGTIIMWNGVALSSAVSLNASAISAIVPNELFTHPGQVQVALKSETGVLSESKMLSIIAADSPEGKGTSAAVSPTPLPVASAPVPAIVRFGPMEASAGIPFNVQPTGESAIWMEAKGLQAGTVILWDGRPLVSASNLAKEYISALVPLDLSKTKGRVALQLKTPSGGLSESVYLTIH